MKWIKGIILLAGLCSLCVIFLTGCRPEYEVQDHDVVQNNQTFHITQGMVQQVLANPKLQSLLKAEE